MTAVGIVFVITLILLGLRYFWKYRLHWTYKIYKSVKNIPGPTCIPILGCPLQFIGTVEHLWNQLRKTAKEFPDIYKMWGFNRCAIFLFEPNDIERVVSSTRNLEKNEAYEFIKDWLGEGLLISAGNKWKSRRKILTPAFHFNILNQFVNVFEENSEKSANFINEHCNMDLNVADIAVEHTLYSLCETTMGISVDINSPDIIQYKEALHNFGGIFYSRITRPWLYPNILYFFSSIRRAHYKLIKAMHKFTLNVINERLSNWDEQRPRTIHTASGKRMVPMLDLLIGEMKRGADIDYEGIREEVDTFMFEGHDTTSTALSFLLMLLANNPDAQNLIFEEQLHIFTDSKRKATYDELQNMEYLDRCIKESLRLYPPVPIIGRILDEDIVLKSKYILPSGIFANIMIYDLHRNPKFWPNPNKFDPDRFLPDNCVNRHPFVYIPFSAGPRNCIGQRFAMLELKSFVSRVIREFILEPIDTPETIVMKADLVLRTAEPIKVKFQRRI